MIKWVPQKYYKVVRKDMLKLHVSSGYIFNSIFCQSCAHALVLLWHKPLGFCQKRSWFGLKTWDRLKNKHLHIVEHSVKLRSLACRSSHLWHSITIPSMSRYEIQVKIGVMWTWYDMFRRIWYTTYEMSRRHGIVTSLSENIWIVLKNLYTLYLFHYVTQLLSLPWGRWENVFHLIIITFFFISHMSATSKGCLSRFYPFLSILPLVGIRVSQLTFTVDCDDRGSFFRKRLAEGLSSNIKYKPTSSSIIYHLQVYLLGPWLHNW